MLERIEESAFSASELRSIVIPSSVVVLGKGSFSGCRSLESVVFENNSRLELIEEFAFSQSGLQSITIPASVTFIDAAAFVRGSLNFVSISPDSETFHVRDWCLEACDGSTIYRYFGGCSSIVIPSIVVVLWKSSFSCCMSLESVVFESGSRLERIEESAFQRSGLKSIVIPSSVVFLGNSSFCDCESVESVIFENGSRLERIEESTLQRSGLRAIVIPSSVVVLGKGSFSGCRSLESVVFESGSRLERIEEFAFSQSGLQSITIPASVTFIDGSAFVGTAVRGNDEVDEQKVEEEGSEAI
jgi:hypothetical protein